MNCCFCVELFDQTGTYFYLIYICVTVISFDRGLFSGGLWSALSKNVFYTLIHSDNTYL